MIILFDYNDLKNLIQQYKEKPIINGSLEILESVFSKMNARDRVYVMTSDTDPKKVIYYSIFAVYKEHLLTREGFRPYCGNIEIQCHEMLTFNGKQFVCQECGWETNYDIKFIRKFKEKWNL